MLVGISNFQRNSNQNCLKKCKIIHYHCVVIIKIISPRQIRLLSSKMTMRNFKMDPRRKYKIYSQSNSRWICWRKLWEYGIEIVEEFLKRYREQRFEKITEGFKKRFREDCLKLFSYGFPKKFLEHFRVEFLNQGMHINLTYLSIISWQISWRIFWPNHRINFCDFPLRNSWMNFEKKKISKILEGIIVDFPGGINEKFSRTIPKRISKGNHKENIDELKKKPGGIKLKLKEYEETCYFFF